MNKLSSYDFGGGASPLSSNGKDFQRGRWLRHIELWSKGFTLAEVLITLAIIGIVAALTIPSLVSNYQDKMFKSAYEKAKTTLVNGYKLMMAKEDVYSIRDVSLFNKCLYMSSDSEIKNCIKSSHNNVFKIIQDAFGDDDSNPMNLPEEYSSSNPNKKSPFSWITYFVSETGSDNDYEPLYIFRLQDGGIYGWYYFHNSSSNYESWSDSLFLAVDINGSNQPNIAGKDLFMFRISGTGNIEDVTFDLEANGCSFDALDKCNEKQCLNLRGKCYDESGCDCDIGKWDYETNTCKKIRGSCPR